MYFYVLSTCVQIVDKKTSTDQVCAGFLGEVCIR